VAIAAYNCTPFLTAAVQSALSQTIKDIEVIIVDDRSTDDTLVVAYSLAGADRRVRVMTQNSNGGPAVARNRALAEAKGKWFAVLDSDDIYLPERLAVMLQAAERTGADIVADNLACFTGDNFAAVGSFIPLTVTGCWVELASYLKGARLFNSMFDLGYLKPLIRLDAIREAGIAYRTTLRVGEDDDLVLRMLDSGLRYWYEPSLTYAYRRHGGSISHRLSAANACAMEAAMAELCQTASTVGCKAALEQRRCDLARERDFAAMVAAVKQRDFLSALKLAVRNPTILPMWQEAIANLVPWPKLKRRTFVEATVMNPNDGGLSGIFERLRMIYGSVQSRSVG
jgi:succinoglycan biosynthesis protein ExoO